MTGNTINNDMTMGDATGALLAGRYRVVRQLGQGGMGSVWLAEDTKLDGFKVAIKMLPSVLVNNKRAYAQVKAEALVSLKLSHSNIATVRAFEEEGGNPFLVMDYIDGQTLDDYLAEKGTLTEEEMVKLLKPVAAALDYAHTQGVVHRDVKPANIMIRKDGHPFILDFGIAREIQETMTRVTGELSSGTLLYMSPEQLNGDAPKPSQDIYSFAAMAYECLKGEPPFTRGAIGDQIKNKTPDLLSGHIAICHSVMAGLAKMPAERPRSCQEVMSVQSNLDGCLSSYVAMRARHGCKQFIGLVRTVGSVLSLTLEFVGRKCRKSGLRGVDAPDAVFELSSGVRNGKVHDVMVAFIVLIAGVVTAVNFNGTPQAIGVVFGCGAFLFLLLRFMVWMVVLLKSLMVELFNWVCKVCKCNDSNNV